MKLHILRLIASIVSFAAFTAVIIVLFGPLVSSGFDIVSWLMNTRVDSYAREFYSLIAILGLMIYAAFAFFAVGIVLALNLFLQTVHKKPNRFPIGFLIYNFIFAMGFSQHSLFEFFPPTGVFFAMSIVLVIIDRIIFKPQKPQNLLR